MALRDDIDNLLKYINSSTATLAHNAALYDIYEGDLLRYVEADLRNQLSPQSFEQARHRLAPINIMRHVIEKLSKIYPPSRNVIGGSDNDAEMLAWYETEMRANLVMNQANEFFNMTKTALVQPYVHNGQPQLRVWPPHKYVAYSDDIVSPTTPTHIVTAHGMEAGRAGAGAQVMVYFAYTANEWIAFDADGNARQDIMLRYGDVSGVNPYGAMPFIYINRSRNCILPPPDSDMLKFAKLPSILMTDLNFISAFQSFSIIFGIDINDENLKFAPNAFWSFKSDPASEKTPQLGQLKPQADIQELLALLQAELTFWMQTRGIKTSFSGTLTVDNAASGISKMVDEIDTYQDRQKQVQYFVDAEQELWHLVLQVMHPIWSRTGMIENRSLFSPSSEFDINFADQQPLLSRKDLVDAFKNEVASGFISRRRAIKQLNPRMTNAEVDALIAEIDGERGAIPADTVMDDEAGGDDTSQD